MNDIAHPNLLEYKSESISQLNENIRKEVERHSRMVRKHGERFIKAFIAVYGCGPEDIEMVTEQFFEESNQKMIMVTYFRMRKK